jgi:hypothetical protein
VIFFRHAISDRAIDQTMIGQQISELKERITRELMLIARACSEDRLPI